VNGYAGTEPREYAKVREAMKEFPSAPSIALLRSMGVRHVLVHLRGFGPNRRQAIEDLLPSFASELRISARFEDDLALEVVNP
jgi:ribosomal protein S11